MFFLVSDFGFVFLVGLFFLVTDFFAKISPALQLYFYIKRFGKTENF
jgi:hypothetical protein